MFPRDSQPLLKSEKFMVLSNLSAKKLPKLFNYFDDCYRTSGSLFSPLFMKGKNTWGSKRKKKEGESISWYKESQPVTKVNTQLLLTPLWFSALCHSIMRKAESDPRCIFTSPLQKCFKAGNDFFHPSRNLPDWGHTWLPGLVLLDAMPLWLFLSSTHRPLKAESLLLNDPGILTEKRTVSLALHQNSQSSRGQRLSSSCPVSTENPKETGVWVAYSFLKLGKREGH